MSSIDRLSKISHNSFHSARNFLFSFSNNFFSFLLWRDPLTLAIYYFFFNFLFLNHFYTYVRILSESNAVHALYCRFACEKSFLKKKVIETRYISYMRKYMTMSDVPDRSAMTNFSHFYEKEMKMIFRHAMKMCVRENEMRVKWSFLMWRSIMLVRCDERILMEKFFF